jgi:hypothetical protein
VKIHFKILLVVFLIFGELKSQEKYDVFKDKYCDNPINYTEYLFLKESLLNKFQNRNYKIKIYDALLAFTFHNSNLPYVEAAEDIYDAIDIFLSPGCKKCIILRRELFKNNPSNSLSSAIVYDDFNFVYGGTRPPCCCLQFYRIDNIGIDSIDNQIKISKFLFDSICNEILFQISNEYIDYRKAIIICRVYNTIVMNNLNENIHRRFLKLFDRLKYKNEVWEILKIGYESYSFPVFDFGEINKKASSYDIVDLNNPNIKYKFD